MKKHILVILSVLICSVNIAMTEAKTAATPAVNNAIKLYKARNYSECYNVLQGIVAQDSSNALAYYYLAMASAQLGKGNEAIENYEKVMILSPNGQLFNYAKKGKTCLTEPDKCHEKVEEMDKEEAFIRGKYGYGLTDEARSKYEQLKIENLMREMNRGKEVDSSKFKNYKDYSGAVPTNDEIVAAIEVLQRAGLNPLGQNHFGTDLSMLTGSNYNNDMIYNMLTGGNNSSINSQMIQSLLTNQMSLGF